MNYQLLTELIGSMAVGLSMTLDPYYTNRPNNKDVMVCDAAAFLLAYLHVQNGIDDREAMNVAARLAKCNPYPNQQAEAMMWMTAAMPFYDEWLWKMYRDHSHTLPDVIVWNLCELTPTKSADLHPMDALKLMEIWSAVTEFLNRRLAPAFNRLCTDE